MMARNLLALFLFTSLAILPAIGQQPPGALLWSYDAQAGIIGCPAVGADNTVYLGTSVGLCAVTNGGSNKWIYTAGGTAKGCPAIASDGTIFFGGNVAESLYALNPDGSLKWSRSLGMKGSSPLLGLSNNVCAVGYGYLYSLDFNGGTNWVSRVGDSGVSTPVMAQDGSIYVAGWDTLKFYAFNADGSSKWVIDHSSIRGDTIAIGGDGTLYLAWGSLYAFSPAGIQLWENSSISFAGGAAPAVGKDGTIYAASDRDESLYAMSAAGDKIWKAAYGPVGPAMFGYVCTTPAIDASGMLYYSSSNSVFAITPQGSVQRIFSSAYAVEPGPPPPIPTAMSPAIGPDGTIYAAFGDILYAIKGNASGLAASPWPMYRQNLRHTGKLERPALSSPEKRPDANYDLQLAGEIGQAYSLQSSSDFLNWSSITSFVAATIPVRLSDLTATNSPKRFYRATSP